MSESTLGVFIAITSLAVLIQAGVMVGMYLSMRKTSERVLQISSQVETKLLPVLETSREILADSAPKIKSITSDLVETSATVRTTVRDLADKGRLQSIRVDQLISSTLDKVEETTEMVNATIVNPVKQIAGIMQGVSVGLGAFFADRKRKPGETGSGQDDEMFI